MQQLDDPALIELIAQKNEGALEELYDRYNRLIFSVAINVVGRREEAEEVALDVFTRVWERAGSYNPERAKVYTWLTRMARNRSIDVLRRENVRPLKHSVAWSEVITKPKAEKDNPETAARITILQERVREAVAALPDNQKEALALAYFKGLSHSEIASKLNIPLGTAKGRIRSGMQKLRGLLQDE